MLGIEPSTFVSKVDILTTTPIVSLKPHVRDHECTVDHIATCECTRKYCATLVQTWNGALITDANKQNIKRANHHTP